MWLFYRKRSEILWVILKGKEAKYYGYLKEKGSTILCGYFIEKEVKYYAVILEGKEVKYYGFIMDRKEVKYLVFIIELNIMDLLWRKEVKYYGLLCKERVDILCVYYGEKVLFIMER